MAPVYGNRTQPTSTMCQSSTPIIQPSASFQTSSFSVPFIRLQFYCTIFAPTTLGIKVSCWYTIPERKNYQMKIYFPHKLGIHALFGKYAYSFRKGWHPKFSWNSLQLLKITISLYPSAQTSQHYECLEYGGSSLSVMYYTAWPQKFLWTEYMWNLIILVSSPEQNETS